MNHFLVSAAYLFEAGILFGAVVFIIHYTWSIFGGLNFAPYVPTPMPVVSQMMDLAELKEGMKVIELGSGDGRICVEAAKRGAKAVGIELDPTLVFRARRRANREGVAERVTFIRGSIWDVPFPADTDVVFIYGLPRYMEKVWNKLKKEVKPGVRIVSHAFQFPEKKPLIEQGRVRVYELS